MSVQTNVKIVLALVLAEHLNGLLTQSRFAWMGRRWLHSVPRKFAVAGPTPVQLMTAESYTHLVATIKAN
jgi:hypothetical protein